MSEPLGMFDELMLRGERLRQLRLLEHEDERQRQQEKRKQKVHYTTIMKKEEKLIITNESMNLVHEDTTSAYHHLSESEHTKSTMCSIHSGSLSGEDDICRYEYSTTFLACQPVEMDDNNLLLLDEEEEEEEEGVDKVDILPDSKLKILRYDSYLSHQRYNDDYKHADCHFVDFGYVGHGDVAGEIKYEKSRYCDNNANRLIIEQQKSLGKGGLVWDAGVILADHLIATQNDWVPTTKQNEEGNHNDDARASSATPTNRIKIVELGAGTGVTGLMLAKAIPKSHVYITDLPDVIRLIERNVERNFHTDSIKTMISDEDLIFMDRGEAAQEIPKVNANKLSCTGSLPQLSEADLNVMYEFTDIDNVDSFQQSSSNVTAKVLRWGMKEDYCDGPFDLIIGADVVASLYDPSALVQTIYDLCHEKSIIYICVRRRLSEYHNLFDNALKEMFDSVCISTPITRHRNVGNIICMMRISGKKVRQ